MRRHRHQSRWIARPEGGGYECCTFVAEVRLIAKCLFLVRTLTTRCSAHTQAVAYLIGESAAEKMIAQYN